MFAHRTKDLSLSQTVDMNTRAAQLNADANPVISLAAGEPDWPTPPAICKSAIRALRQGKTRYSEPAGILPLRKKIVSSLQHKYQLSYETNEITITSGAKQAIFNAFMATLNHSDEVIIPAPYWSSFVEITKLCEADPIIVPCPQQQNFKLQPLQLENAISKKTKWLILNSPCNPTGSLYHQDELKELAKILLKHPHIRILSDDIYTDFIYPPNVFYNIVQVEPRLKKQTLIVNGFSKSYAMTGWRIGYCAGDQHLIKAMINLQSHSTTAVNSFVQWAAIEALELGETFTQENIQKLKTRLNLVIKTCNNIGYLECFVPEGAFYAYINCQALIGAQTPSKKIITCDSDLAFYLLEYAKISCVPGKAFGLEPYLRISYAVSLEQLKTAMKRMEQALQQLQLNTPL
ncbi:MAG: pyridoxal phosphate-dependent aminotransferase [Pseudomonadota bacterium]